MSMKATTAKKKISEIIAIAGMTLLIIYIADAGVGKGEIGFLPMDEKERGIIFGYSTIILFFVAFGIGLNEKKCCYHYSSYSGWSYNRNISIGRIFNDRRWAGFHFWIFSRRNYSWIPHHGTWNHESNKEKIEFFHLSSFPKNNFNKILLALFTI
jgi:hypothetical protein